MHHVFALLAVGLAMVALGPAACGPTAIDAEHQEVTDENYVAINDDPDSAHDDDHDIDRTIGDGDTTIAIMSAKALADKVASRELAPAGSSAASRELAKLTGSHELATAAAGSETRTSLDSAPTSAARAAVSEPATLLATIPYDLLGKEHVFGAVITAVKTPANLSQEQAEEYGSLKLADLPALHVKLALAGNATAGHTLNLVGCAQNCSSDVVGSTILVRIPIVAVDAARGRIVVDVAALGRGLKLPELLGVQMTVKSNTATMFDYSNGTLVFEVATRLAPPSSASAADVVHMSSRWYLKLAKTAMHAGFVARDATDGVGYFMTGRGTRKRITRFALKAEGRSPGIHYFVKNVPAAHKAAFAAAFQAWNDTFREVAGEAPLTWEFIDASDSRARLIVTGDIRYNVVEWDLANLAPYGGLGPSIANQRTGETFSANVLVQGPAIVKLYAEWFRANAAANALIAEGSEDDAQALLASAQRKLVTRHESLLATGTKTATMHLSLGEGLAFRIPALSPPLQDAAARRLDFDAVPAGHSFETYMARYWQELLGHELGHNLGLRHNFRGNLGAAAVGSTPPAVGSVTRSIMEYLGRAHRHLSGIGAYDRMALAYGYRGARPMQTTWFCTDEHVASDAHPTNSAECSKDDATSDPFGYLAQRLRQGIGLLTARGSTTAPNWTLDEMEKDIVPTLQGLASYASSAASSASKWTNWRKAGRPSEPAAIKAFVINDVKQALCDPQIAAAVAAKSDETARSAAAANVASLRSRASEIAAKFGLAAWSCQ